jgi:hypothetical protein
MEYAKDVAYPVIIRSPGKQASLLLYQNGDCRLVMEYAKDVCILSSFAHLASGYP